MTVKATYQNLRMYELSSSALGAKIQLDPSPCLVHPATYLQQSTHQEIILI